MVPFCKKNGLEATIMSSQVDSVPYVHKKEVNFCESLEKWKVVSFDNLETVP